MESDGMRGTAALLMSLPLMAASITGCTGLLDTDGSEGEGGALNAPEWEIGDWWLYTFSTPDYFDDSAKLVIASTDEEDGDAYMLAISSEAEALRHAVLNHNPFLGRITKDNLSPYENGIPQSVLIFPITEGESWSFTLFSTEWAASVTSVGDEAIITASNLDGSRLDYVYDNDVRLFSTFIWTDSNGSEQLRMMLSDHGIGHTGEVHFVRGGDLFSGMWEDSGNDAELRDSFLVSEHPTDGEWDEMIYFIDADSGSGSSISFTLRDHMSVSMLADFWGPGASEWGTMGTIPYPSGEYTMTATFTGSSTYLRVRISAGISQSWNI
ncbi:MAG TPA: hypothetical protein QF703_02670 [Candidatus Thalassarchaeaceae archaeon]|nr:hypothetical protein [Candidatus Thalassarchaeaceae archaeon]